MLLREHALKQESEEDNHKDWVSTVTSSSESIAGSWQTGSASKTNESAYNSTLINGKTEIVIVKAGKVIKLEGEEPETQQKLGTRKDKKQVSGNFKTTVERRTKGKNLQTAQQVNAKSCKRGRKKRIHVPTTSAFPVPIQPKLLPYNPLRYQIFCGPGLSNNEPQLTHMQPNNQCFNVVGSSSQKTPQSSCNLQNQVSCLQPQQQHSVSLALASVVNSSQNPYVIQVCGNQLASGSSNLLNQVMYNPVGECLSSSAIQNSVPLSLVQEKLKSYPTLLSRNQPIQQASVLGTSSTLQIQIPSRHLVPSTPTSLHPVVSGQSVQGSFQNKVQIQLPSSNVMQAAAQTIISSGQSNSKTPLQIHIPSNQLVPSDLMDPIQNQNPSSNFLPTSSKVLVKNLAPSFQTHNNSEIVKANTIPFQITKNFKPVITPVGSLGKKIMIKYEEQGQFSSTVVESPNHSNKQAQMSAFHNISDNIQMHTSQHCHTRCKNEAMPKRGRRRKQQNSDLSQTSSRTLAPGKPPFIQPLMADQSDYVTVQLSTKQILQNLLTSKGFRRKRVPVQRGTPVPIRPKSLPCCQKDADIPISGHNFPQSDALQSFKLGNSSSESKPNIHAPLITPNGPHTNNGPIILFSSVNANLTEIHQKFGMPNSSHSDPGITVNFSSNFSKEVVLPSELTATKRSASKTLGWNSIPRKRTKACQVTTISFPKHNRSKLLKQQSLTETKSPTLNHPMAQGNVLKSKQRTRRQFKSQSPGNRSSTGNASTVPLSNPPVPLYPKYTTITSLNNQNSATVLPEEKVLTKENTARSSRQNGTNEMIASKSPGTNTAISNTPGPKANGEKILILDTHGSISSMDSSRNKKSGEVVSLGFSSINNTCDLNTGKDSADPSRCRKVSSSALSKSAVSQLQAKNPKYVTILPRPKSRFVPILPRPADNHMCIFSQTAKQKGNFWGAVKKKKKLVRKRKGQTHKLNSNKVPTASSSEEVMSQELLAMQQCFVKLEMLKVEPQTTYNASNFML